MEPVTKDVRGEILAHMEVEDRTFNVVTRKQCEPDGPGFKLTLPLSAK